MSHPLPSHAQAPAADARAADPSDSPVAQLLSELVRYDSSALGEFERKVAERVALELSELGLSPQVLESAPNRTNVVARISGTNPRQDALLVHIHLDVVPADPSAWTVSPYAGEIRDGYVWGRGTVDMKNMAAMTLSAFRVLLGTGWRPRRDIVLAFVADEELGGGLGARWLVEEHRDLFADCTEAIGEAGGFSYEFAQGKRAYLVQTGEKGIGWLRLVARGPGGHGSMSHAGNPIVKLSEAIQRLEHHDFPVHLCRTSEGLVEAARKWHAVDNADAALNATGSLAKLLVPTLRNTYNATQLDAGLQHNVVPPAAHANIDGRFVPGYEKEFYEEVESLVGDLVDVERALHSDALETPFLGRVPQTIADAIATEDPEGVALPVCLPIGTDAKHFARLGINCYGFIPLQLPTDFDFPAMFHGADERVPASALTFGERVLTRFFSAC